MAFILLLWSIEAFEYAFSLDFRQLGILPRTLKGTIGIITGPLVHGDVFHLISNTFPLIVLGVGIFYFYDRIAFEVIFLIYFLTGFWVWMTAREAYHIGASGIVYGLLSFLFFSGLLRREPKTLAVSLILLFIYGGNMIYGVFPVNSTVSWESHLIGAITGLFCAVFFRNVNSSVEEKNYLLDETLDVKEKEQNKHSTSNTDIYFKYKLKKTENKDPDKKSRTNTYQIRINKNELI